MSTKIAVIGAGPGGYVAAIRAAQLGADVTLIEQENVGGTCLNWGCIPSKIMKTTADLLEDFKKAATLGVQITGAAHPDMVQLNDRKKAIIRNQAQGILNLIKQNGVSYLSGTARISGEETVSVSIDGENTITVPWDKLVISTGSSPFCPEAFSFDDARILSSNDALRLQEVPRSMLILGGGVIGCEFASIFAALGAQVTVVEGLSRLLPLPSIEETCSKILQREFKKRSIKFNLNQTVIKVDGADRLLRITLAPSALGNAAERPGAPVQTVEAEKMLVCIGRQPNTDDIHLDRIHVAVDNRGWVLADEHMQTNIPGVYAVGDVLGPSKIMLAHVASTEGIIAAENAMGRAREMEYRAVPSTIFTHPEVAAVGLTEARAREQGYGIRVDGILFRALGKAHVIGDIAGEVKIVSSEDDGKILGVHIIGPHAADLIAEGCLAVKQGTTVRELAETIHAHPTLAEAMSECAHKALGHPIHG